MRSHLAKSGLDVSLVKEVRGTTTGSASITVVDGTGENCILIVGGANEKMTGEENVLNGVPKDAYHLAVFQLESPLEAVRNHVKKLHENKALVGHE
jgi:ribokinase